MYTSGNDKKQWHLAKLAGIDIRIQVAIVFAVIISTACGAARSVPLAAAAAPSLGTASSFAVLSAPMAGSVVTCTSSTVNGNVGFNGTMASVVQSENMVTWVITAPVSSQVITNFNSVYGQYAAIPCTGQLNTSYTDTNLTLTPGVYCSAEDVTFTNSKLTLDGQGNANALWVFKIGAHATGTFTGTNFTVNMAGSGQPCNVNWWVAKNATMTTSGFQGTILASGPISVTGLSGTTPSFMGDALSNASVQFTNVNITSCKVWAGVVDTIKAKKAACNQGVGNGPEGCDPGNSNQGDPSRSNDENGGTTGNPGRKGGNDK